MSARLHIWVANPQSLSEMTEFMGSLEMALPKSEAEMRVICEKKFLAISVLTEGLAYSEEARKTIANAASVRGITGATAMFGLRSESAIPSGPYRDGIVYLGGFEDGESMPIDKNWDAIPLYRSVFVGDMVAAKQILSSNAESIFEKNEVGHTPLMVSATKERPEMTKMLVSAGVRVDDVTPENNFTALHWALNHPPRNPERVFEIVKTLISNGSDINALGHNGLTPLMMASWFGAKEAVEFLLKNGADLNSRDFKGRTAKDIASHRGHSQIAMMLG
jgi:hypothetical protein